MYTHMMTVVILTPYTHIRLHDFYSSNTLTNILYIIIIIIIIITTSQEGSIYYCTIWLFSSFFSWNIFYSFLNIYHEECDKYF